MLIAFINKSGEILAETSGFQSIEKFSEDLAMVRNTQSFCGFVDKNGKVIIEPKFFAATSFSEGLAAVKTSEKGFLFQSETKWGFIDKNGQIVYEENFDYLSNLSEGIAIAAKDKETFLIDRTGKTILKVNADKMRINTWNRQNTKFSENLILISDPETNKHGFMDKTGNLAVKPKFENAASFSEGLARVSVIKNSREMLGFINSEGEFVIPPVFDIDGDFTRCADDFSEGLAGLIDGPPMMEKNPSFMFINKTGDIAIKTVFFQAESFHEELAVVWDAESEKYGYINKSGKLELPLTYSFAGDFSEGLAVVSF